MCVYIRSDIHICTYIYMYIYALLYVAYCMNRVCLMFGVFNYETSIETFIPFSFEQYRFVMLDHHYL